MPTLRKRINITPSDEVWALIDQVHALTGTPKAAIVSELLEEIAPVFQTTIQALSLVKEQPREAQRLVQNFANESVASLVRQENGKGRKGEAEEGRWTGNLLNEKPRTPRSLAARRGTGLISQLDTPMVSPVSILLCLFVNIVQGGSPRSGLSR
jgi:hypothetical protein